MADCPHAQMVRSTVTTDGRFYSHCPDCGQDFHPDSVEVSGEDSTPPPPIDVAG